MRGRKPNNPKVKDLSEGVLRVVDGGRGKPGDGKTPPAKVQVEKPPAWMKDKIAIAEWNRLLPDLKLRRQYIPLFQSELARYCNAHGQYVMATKELAKTGYVTKSAKGTDMYSHFWVIQSRAHEVMSKLAADLGLNPVSQNRIAGAQFDLFDVGQPPQRPGADDRAGGGNPFSQFRR